MKKTTMGGFPIQTHQNQSFHLTRRVGVTKVRQGFSMPPYGKDGGRQSTSYRPHS